MKMLTVRFIFFRVIFEDDENCLTSVTLFRRAVDEFKHKCRENK